ncbi:maleylpyruvate isomerase N-terminal domain-containing protein [Streptomyces sp. TP-A0874]|uniref:maleylpyruvate isomerase N-terminal domain-containing protein n=1 Tax=Streptomyces sp. TP-A0874 TaxID=549819 RepID=UPI00085311C4|nr:maleylpyruvate isomerase N-terminal domain-containing protein [Streptomyces sp. TP-A0874]
MSEDSGFGLPVPEDRSNPSRGPRNHAPAGVCHADEHRVLKSLLGAWALAACSPEETAAVEEHLTDCAPCADEALRLRTAVGLLHSEDSLDLDPLLRSRVIEGCLGRRPARIPLPSWAAPYDAESARLDALLRDMGEDEWRAPVRLKWFQDERQMEREATVAGVISHLTAADGLVAAALGIPEQAGTGSAARRGSGRTEDGRGRQDDEAPAALREPWRAQARAVLRTASRAGPAVAEVEVAHASGLALPLCDSFLDRAFECWVHAGDIAEAIDYPYSPPLPHHLNDMIDLGARMLPEVLASRRRAGLAGPVRTLVAAGAPGRTLHLEVEGSGGGDWFIPLDSPAAVASREAAVAHVALDEMEFCRLASGHVSPEEAAAGQHGDREAIRDVLSATASLSCV